MKSDSLIDAVRSALGDFPIAIAILFGSHATGRARPDSDVDLAVDVGRPLTPEQKISLIAALAERTGLPIDLVDLRTVGEPLLGEILRDGKRLLGTDDRYAELVYRHLCDAADFLPYVERMLAERRAKWLGK